MKKLYNNVILEDGFSSKPCDFSDTPYLKDRPDIIDVAVGRQLFVDNFLIENTDLTPEYHKAKKIRGQSRSLPRNALGERSFSRRLPQKRWRVVRRGRI